MSMVSTHVVNDLAMQSSTVCELSCSPGIDADPGSTSLPSEVADRLNEYSQLVGFPLTCIDLRTGEIATQTGIDSLPWFPADLQEQLQTKTEPCIWERSTEWCLFALPLSSQDQIEYWAVGACLTDPRQRPQEFVLAVAEFDWSEAQLKGWLANQNHCAASMLRKLIDIAFENSAVQSEENALLEEIDYLTQEIDQKYEEICLLHTMTGNLQISQAPCKLAEICLDRLVHLVKAEQLLVLLNESECSNGNKAPRMITVGRPVIHRQLMLELIDKFGNSPWSTPAVKNHLTRSFLGRKYSQLRNLILAPISESQCIYGWILACNHRSKEEFGTVEASLINSVASILATHTRNIDLYQQHDELSLSFVLSLVSTLDAKDHYTRGHSERVALIGRRLAQEYGLADRELHDLYLAGLLHDIGKIGVNDSILCKPGQLDNDEFQQIQKHPVVGYDILRQVKNLQQVIPGVRYHHESFDGRGYPDGLAGEDIPLMARLLAVADSFDAMVSDRPYRKGMPVANVEKIFREGSGSQWDPRVIEVYFDIRDDVRQLSDQFTASDGNLLLHPPIRS